jgi:plasmid stability protein
MESFWSQIGDAPVGINLSIKNVPEEIAEVLRTRAKENHRSLQGELMAILEDAAAKAPQRKLSVDEIVARVRKLGLTRVDEATQMIREDRDSR